ncbi:MAG: hypothetical protein K6F33_08805 [Bacteroidales bacterium]|nr:hypothetical protein [Bacteroidales bacterium]
MALFTVSGVFAQASWKSTRHSLYFGIGVNAPETDVAPYDGLFPKIHTFNGSLQIGYENRFAERFSWRANFLLSRLQAFDKDGDTDGDYKYAENRYLNFRTWVFDINAMLNFYFIKPKDVTPESTFWQKWSGFVTVGFGGAFYEPMTALRGPSGQSVWVHTRHLGAECTKWYHGTTLTLPYGLGFKFQASKKYSIGIEALQHVCFTDYIDNVTSNPVVAKIEKGTLGGVQQAARGNRGGIPGGDAWDQYTTFMITLGYTFTPCGIKHVARPKYLN